MSPTLFNIYMLPLHEIKDEGVELVQYADDFAILITGKNIEHDQHERTNVAEQF